MVEADSAARTSSYLILRSRALHFYPDRRGRELLSSLVGNIESISQEGQWTHLVAIIQPGS